MKKIVFFVLTLLCMTQISFAVTPEANCKRYFDGCNQCSRVEFGSEMACTMMACAEDQAPKCLEYFSTGTTVGLANPASVNCEKNGGTLTISTDSTGAQTGMCTFSNGKVCEEWAFYRGECSASLPSKACTREYMPVCAEPPMPACLEGMMCAQVMPAAKTYPNKCSAEAENATIISEGECASTSELGVFDGSVGGEDVKICTMEYAPVCGSKSVQCIKAPCFPITQTYGNKCEAQADNAQVMYSGECLNSKVETAVQTALDKIMVKVPTEKVPTLVERVVKKIDLLLSQENVSEFKKSVLGYLKTLLQTY